MKSMRLYLLLLFIFLQALFSAAAYATQSEPVDTGRVSSQLISSHHVVSAGEGFDMGLALELDPHWHSYWKNPGDSGAPITLAWDMPEWLRAGEIIWPVPKRIITGPLMTYGLEDQLLLPIPFEVAADAPTGEVKIFATAYYLVCKDVCIPETAELSIDLNIGETQLDSFNRSLIDEARASAPKRGDITGAITKIDEALLLSFTDIATADISEAYFYPYEQGYISHFEPQALELGDKGLALKTKADYLWDEDAPESLSGVLSYTVSGQARSQIVDLQLGEPLDIGPVIKALPVVTPPATAQAPTNKITIWAALIGAFLGGLVLNLMPCVFPVISLKALSIAKAGGQEVSVVKREAWAYTFGVVATFLFLALALIAFKSAGHQAGWGFQLQSPWLVGLLALLLFAIGLNLLGLFEIGGSLQGVGQELTQKTGARGAFFTGALAVVVATPCTAPFMASAVGYALAQPAMIALIVFLALAIGFALPFLLIAYIPAMRNILPKPGAWMKRFQKILAIPMLLAALWLVWVLSRQAGAKGVMISLVSMGLLLVSVVTWKASPKAKLLAVLALVAAWLTPLTLRPQPELAKTAIAQGAQAWSPELVRSELLAGKTVFVDFTADWCVTCKVNKFGTLSKPAVKSRLSDYDVAFLIADWTNADPAISAELEKHGRSGVPLYLVFKPETGLDQPQILSQLLSQNEVLAALK